MSLKGISTEASNLKDNILKEDPPILLSWPKFTRTNVRLWFRMLEFTFINRNIYSERTRFEKIAHNYGDILDPNEWTDIETKSNKDQYTCLKQKLVLKYPNVNGKLAKRIKATNHVDSDKQQTNFGDNFDSESDKKNNCSQLMKQMESISIK